MNPDSKGNTAVSEIYCWIWLRFECGHRVLCDLLSTMRKGTPCSGCKVDVRGANLVKGQAESNILEALRFQIKEMERLSPTFMLGKMGGGFPWNR